MFAVATVGLKCGLFVSGTTTIGISGVVVWWVLVCGGRGWSVFV